MKNIKRIGLMALSTASAVGLMLATATAADYNDEQIEVTAPRHHVSPSIPGAEIRDVAMSREVRFDDLNLRSERGAHALKNRIRSTARTLCRQLEFMHPVAVDDGTDCYRNAVNEAMYQADDAIAQARGYAYDE